MQEYVQTKTLPGADFLFMVGRVFFWSFLMLLCASVGTPGHKDFDKWNLFKCALSKIKPLRFVAKHQYSV